MTIRQSQVTWKWVPRSPSKVKSQPTLQREQKQKTGNKNDWRALEGGGRAALAVAAPGVPAQVAGGQLRFGVVASHRASPCPKRRASVYMSPLFGNAGLAKT